MPVKNVKEYIATHPGWEKELIQLRNILTSTEMDEHIKWGIPVYTIRNKNVVGIAAFKNHCALWFYKGALLKENTALLLNAQEGKTKTLRQICFKKGDVIKPKVLQKYIEEAIQNQKEGKEIKPETHRILVIPSELRVKFQEDQKLKLAFQKLTKGKQREYTDYISEAKRETTKKRRLEKIIPMIMEGKSLNEKYKNS